MDRGLIDHWLIIVYCGLIVSASLLGGLLPLMGRMTHTMMQFAVSFVAGVMLGVGFLHMLPHALQMLDQPKTTMSWVLSGFLLMFFIQRYLIVHQHPAPREQSASEHECGESDEMHHHHHEDVVAAQQDPRLAPRSSWVGAALGLSLHSLLNGVALAAAYQSQVDKLWLAGGATFVAIVVHKPFDSLAIATLMAAAGWSRQACLMMNTLFALAIPLGVAMFYLGLRLSPGTSTSVLGCALGISAGVFLCIASSDLLPEMHFHAHDRGQLSCWLLAGVGLAYVITNVVP